MFVGVTPLCNQYFQNVVISIIISTETQDDIFSAEMHLVNRRFVHTACFALLLQFTLHVSQFYLTVEQHSFHRMLVWVCNVILCFALCQLVCTVLIFDMNRDEWHSPDLRLYKKPPFHQKEITVQKCHRADTRCTCDKRNASTYQW